MWKKHLFVLLYFFLGAIYITFPLILHITDALPAKGDELLITWILHWDVYAFFHQPFHFFEANIFYPYHNSLAFSDAFIVSAVIALIPLHLLREPAAMYNVNLLIAFATLGFSTYLLVASLSSSKLAGMVSGTLVAFSTYTITKTMHLQLLSIAFVPFSILFFIRFLESKKNKFLYLSALMLVLQTYNSFLPGYFIVVSNVIIFFFFYKNKKISLSQICTKNMIITAFITLLFLLPVMLPYLHVSSDFHYTRDIRDSIHFANRLEYSFYPGGRTKVAPVLLNTLYTKPIGPYGYDGYIGLPFYLLFFISLYFFYQHTLKKQSPYIGMFFFIALFSFLLSLGPALQWAGKVIKYPFMIPLPYALMYYLVPGFQGFRNSARWEMLFLLTASVGIGIVYASFIKKISNRKKVILTFLICFGVLYEATFPMSISLVVKKENFPKVYSYIESLPANAIIAEFPLYNWNMFPYAIGELDRQYYGSIHYKKTVNGASGFSPPPWQEMVSSTLVYFPDERSITLLKSLHVTHLILHKSEYDMVFRKKDVQNMKKVSSWEEVITGLSKFKQIKLVKKFGTDYVYEITYE